MRDADEPNKDWHSLKKTKRHISPEGCRLFTKCNQAALSLYFSHNFIRSNSSIALLATKEDKICSHIYSKGATQTILEIVNPQRCGFLLKSDYLRGLFWRVFAGVTALYTAWRTHVKYISRLSHFVPRDFSEIHRGIPPVVAYKSALAALPYAVWRKDSVDSRKRIRP